MRMIRALDAHDVIVIDPVRDVPPLFDVARLTHESLAPQALSDDAPMLPSAIALADVSAPLKEQALQRLGDRESADQLPGFSTLAAVRGTVAAWALHCRHAALMQDGLSGQRWLFRLHDPAVLHQLRWMLTPGELADLLGPTHHLSYVLADQWHRLDVERSARQRLSAAQRQRLLSIGAINQVERRLALAGPAPAWRSGAAIERLIVRAMSTHGFSRTQDQVDFAVRGMTLHPRFDDHPHMRTMLQGRVAEDSFADLMMDISDDEWQTIAAELPPEEGPRHE